MRHRYLEVTFRKGKAVAAYLYLPRGTNEKAARTLRQGPHLAVDYAEDGRAIGVEIIAPADITVAELNEVLTRLGQPNVAPAEVAPLHLAA